MGHGKRKRSRLSGDRRYLVIHGSAAQDLARLDTQDLVPIPQALAPSAGKSRGGSQRTSGPLIRSHWCGRWGHICLPWARMESRRAPGRGPEVRETAPSVGSPGPSLPLTFVLASLAPWGPPGVDWGSWALLLVQGASLWGLVAPSWPQAEALSGT